MRNSDGVHVVAGSTDSEREPIRVTPLVVGVLLDDVHALGHGLLGRHDVPMVVDRDAVALLLRALGGGAGALVGGIKALGDGADVDCLAVVVGLPVLQAVDEDLLPAVGGDVAHHELLLDDVDGELRSVGSIWKGTSLDAVRAATEPSEARDVGGILEGLLGCLLWGLLGALEEGLRIVHVHVRRRHRGVN